MEMLAASGSAATTRGGARPGRVAFAMQGLLYACIVVALLRALMHAYGVDSSGPYSVLTFLAATFSFGLLGRVDLLAPWRIGRPDGPGTRMLYLWLTIVGLLLFLGYVAKTVEVFSRVVMLAWIVMTPAALLAVNVVARGFARRFLPHAVDRRSAIVISIGEGTRTALFRVLGQSEEFELLGYFDDRAAPRSPTAGPDGVRLGTVAAAKEYIQKQGVAVVFVTLPDDGVERVSEIMDELGDTTASVYFVPRFAHYASLGADLSMVEGVPMLRVAETPMFGVHGLYKHMFDVVSALIGLVLLAPLLLLIALAVRLDSPGPVLYRQKRYGLNGRPFDVYKFRTMRVNDPEDRIVQVARDDPRVTRVGSFLRRTSLDELPQLWNVVLGDMSLVGPRPHAVQHNEYYRKAIKQYMLRHKVKPGLTGWAQVNGLRGPSAELATMEERLRYDLDYIRRWSPLFDLKILLRTLIMVLRDRNAF